MKLIIAALISLMLLSGCTKEDINNLQAQLDDVVDMSSTQIKDIIDDIENINVEIPEEIMPEVISSNKTVEIPKTENISVLEQEIIDLTNEYRVSLGLNELEEDSRLTDIARIRSQEIVTNWSHIRADGSMYSDMIRDIDYDYYCIGENLARYQKTPEEALKMWKESPSHNENLVGEYTKIGVGVYEDKDGNLYYAQIFAK